MKQSFIGISPRFNIDSNNNSRALKINMDYIKQVLAYNKTPLIILENDNLEDDLKLCDGFLVIGGNDIDPKYFGETNDDNLSKEIDEITDEIDLKIVEYAVKNKVPLLGICRGHQAIAAFLGGSLHQDFASKNLSHPEFEKKHYITKVTNTKLSNQLPDKFLTNTFHHQSINKLPEGFITTFVNEDIIEAIEHKTLPIIGVQWHPERYYTNESKIIFDYFYQLVDEFKKNK